MTNRRPARRIAAAPVPFAFLLTTLLLAHAGGSVPVEGDGVAFAPVFGIDVRGARLAPSLWVLVEDRLLDGTGAEDEASLIPALATFAADLAAEGWRVEVQRASFARDDAHRDGAQLLALREALRERATEDLSFAGVVLVGAFPDAYLVRTVNWRKRTPLVLRAGTPDERRFDEPVSYLRTVPEDVAHVCDLVLADLDGGWERLYAEPRERLPTLHAVFPDGVPEEGGVTAHFERGTVVYEDFFHVNDGLVDVREVLDADGAVSALHVVPLDDVRDAECSAVDRARPNPIARPDVLVSRIDARGVADDLAHERSLLCAYFARNHAYRSGTLAVPFRPASLAHDLGSGYRSAARASDAWVSEDAASLDVHGRPTRADARAWFGRAAVFRTIRAHSDRWGSALEDGKVDAAFLRGLYEDGITGAGASFYVHTGCEAISPANAERRPWHDPEHGRGNGAAATLFFADGLALIGRAKVFYDEPPGFSETLAAGGTFGDAWRRTFEIESNAASWDHAGGDIGRKRTYFWSLLGDWTLRLSRPPGR